MAATNGDASNGPAVDRKGSPVIDPTHNVLLFVDAAVSRQDDLREMQARYMEQIANLRSEHDRDLREAEGARIDAIRAVDKQAVDTAASAQGAAAQVLSQTVALTAEQQRTQVAAVATAAAVSLAAALEPMAKDIADLRRVQYEQQGQRAQQVETRGQSNWVIGAAIAASTALVSIAYVVVTLVTHDGSTTTTRLPCSSSVVATGQTCIK